MSTNLIQNSTRPRSFSEPVLDARYDYNGLSSLNNQLMSLTLDAVAVNNSYSMYVLTDTWEYKTNDVSLTVSHFKKRFSLSNKIFSPLCKKPIQNLCRSFKKLNDFIPSLGSEIKENQKKLLSKLNKVLRQFLQKAGEENLPQLTNTHP